MLVCLFLLWTTHHKTVDDKQLKSECSFLGKCDSCNFYIHQNMRRTWRSIPRTRSARLLFSMERQANNWVTMRSGLRVTNAQGGPWPPPGGKAHALTPVPASPGGPGFPASPGSPWNREIGWASGHGREGSHLWNHLQWRPRCLRPALQSVSSLKGQETFPVTDFSFSGERPKLQLSLVSYQAGPSPRGHQPHRTDSRCSQPRVYLCCITVQTIKFMDLTISGIFVAKCEFNLSLTNKQIFW